MNSTSPRFTGIFIPVEILQIEILSLFEMMLLSWIDALYCPEHGGCYASNQYLASKLKNVKENTVVKSLVKLRKLGYIQDVSFNGRVRVIKARIGDIIESSRSQSGYEKNHTLRTTKITGHAPFSLYL